MSWTNVCVEGFCFAEQKDGKYPCGKVCPSVFCLENHICPHFAYGRTDERMVAHFVPFHLILKDKLGIWIEELWWKLRWIFWDRLPRNKRKMEEFFARLPDATPESCPLTAKFEEEKEKAKQEFEQWFTKVKNDSEEDMERA